VLQILRDLQAAVASRTGSQHPCRRTGSPTTSTGRTKGPGEHAPRADDLLDSEHPDQHAADGSDLIADQGAERDSDDAVRRHDDEPGRDHLPELRRDGHVAVPGANQRDAERHREGERGGGDDDAGDGQRQLLRDENARATRLAQVRRRSRAVAELLRECEPAEQHDNYLGDAKADPYDAGQEAGVVEGHRSVLVAAFGTVTAIVSATRPSVASSSHAGSAYRAA
jgi:hypothetical protein